MPTKKIKINRAPVLTLWATVVAERLGHSHRTALTLGKAVAGLNAQAKGQRLGIFEKPKEKPLKITRKREKPKEEFVSLLGRQIPTTQVSGEARAVIRDEVIDPESVAEYLSQKFSEDLAEAETAMRDLAKAHKPKNLALAAYSLYEKFRPNVPAGEKGWGAKGELDLALIRSLARLLKGMAVDSVVAQYLTIDEESNPMQVAERKDGELQQLNYQFLIERARYRIAADVAGSQSNRRIDLRSRKR